MIKLSKLAMVGTLLSDFSRDELRHIARNLGLPTGRDRSDTLKVVHQAVLDNAVHFSAHVFLRTKRNWQNGKYNPNLGQWQEDLIQRRFRTHRPNKTYWLKPSVPKSRTAKVA